MHLDLLKRLVAFGFVLEMKSNKDFTGHLSPALGTAYIRFSFGFSDASMPPCQFVCFVSCDKATYLDKWKIGNASTIKKKKTLIA